jgi:NAD(P)-dependent dehydrogenase (short-subunit alcohol dehydrogenase family)
MAGRLDGKVAVITGGTSGIGRATAELFVREGARVLVGDIADDEGAALEAACGPACAYRHADVTREEDISALVDDAVERFGTVDVMFNNAGAGGEPTGYADLNTEGFDRGLDLLLRAVVLGHKHAARVMIPRGGGSIISTASIAGYQGGWGRPAYDAAKGAIYNIVRSATAELGPHGIRSNAIAPGIIITPIMTRGFDLSEAQRDAFLARLAEETAPYQPLRRAGRPEDIAEAALFLASDGSAWMTGQTMIVDGGITAVTQVDLGGAVMRTYEAIVNPD